jgi:hypothetical protein
MFMNRSLIWILALSLSATIGGCSSQSNPSDNQMMGNQPGGSATAPAAQAQPTPQASPSPAPM